MFYPLNQKMNKKRNKAYKGIDMEKMKRLDRETVRAKWLEFFESFGYVAEIQRVGDNFPEERSLRVLFGDVDHFDPDFALYVLEYPDQAIFDAGKAAVLDTLLPEQREKVEARPPGINIRLIELPDDSFVEVRRLRHEHVDRLIKTSGIVKRATAVRPRLLEGVFRCKKCGALIREPQDALSRTIREPIECYKEQGGCGKTKGQTSFDILPRLSRFVDMQTIQIQEEMEGLRGGAQPRSMQVILEDDLVDVVFPGDRVRISGILRAVPQRRGQEKLNRFDTFIEAVSIEMEKTDYESLEPSEEELEEIIDLSTSPDLVEKIKNSIAPNIYGYSEVKEAIALQMFGGVPKETPGGARIRGDIHILLVGDPGTAKSQILREVAAIAPRGIYASGKSASAAGLTATAVKDEASDGRWTLEAGTLVLADMGTACIDELDKMSEQDRSAMHEAMEQQTITVAKAGINATLRARCSILGAANPKKGRFDTFLTMVDQIDMPPTLLSRFDLIFVMTDEPNEQKDTDIASHILAVHRVGEVARQRDPEAVPAGVDVDLLDVERERVVAPIRRDLLRKYVAYAKKYVFPILSDEAAAVIKDYYVSLRGRAAGQEGPSPVPITARQLEAVIRLSEASARMRLSSVVEKEDVHRALRIFNYYLSKIAMDTELGTYDIDMIVGPMSHRERKKGLELRSLIVEMVKERRDGVTLEEILEEAKEHGFNEREAEIILEKLHEMGEIWESGGRFKAVSRR